MKPILPFRSYLTGCYRNEIFVREQIKVSALALHAEAQQKAEGFLAQLLSAIQTSQHSSTVV